MKKAWLYTSLTILVTATLLLSCEKEKKTNDQQIIRITDNNVEDDYIVDAGDTAKIDFSVHCDDTIYSLLLLKGSDTMVYKLDSFTTDTSDRFTYSFPADSSLAGLYVSYKLKVTDLNDSSLSYAIAFYVNPTIYTYTHLYIGAQDNNTYGHFINVPEGKVYMLPDALNYQELVNIIYYYGTNGSVLAAPHNQNVQQINDYEMFDWGIFNTTTFTSVDFTFNNIRTKQDIDSVFESSSAIASEITNINVGNEIGFVTHTKKKGLIKIVGMAIGESGSIEINLKMQK
jgi:hypothetical protein